jgi:hypothetical protein
MIAGNRSDRLTVKTYHSGEELDETVKKFLENVRIGRQ